MPIVLIIGLIQFIYSQNPLNPNLYVKINDTLYFSKYEVSNELYNKFLSDSQYKNLSDVLIDTTQWLKKDHYSAPHANYYHNHPSFSNFPVVNISYQAAKLFCQWLTEQYNKDKNRKFRKVYFRLPTEQEWEEAARGGNKDAIYGWMGNDITDKKGNPKGNYLNEKNYNNYNLLYSVHSFAPNAYGIFNMSGNVSEMIEGGEILKGGDWMHEYEFCKINTKMTWDGKPRPNVGFRVVMVVNEK